MKMTLPFSPRMCTRQWAKISQRILFHLPHSLADPSTITSVIINTTQLPIFMSPKHKFCYAPDID